jgi:hypothetical protein
MNLSTALCPFDAFRIATVGYWIFHTLVFNVHHSLRVIVYLFLKIRAYDKWFIPFAFFSCSFEHSTIVSRVSSSQSNMHGYRFILFLGHFDDDVFFVHESMQTVLSRAQRWFDIVIIHLRLQCSHFFGLSVRERVLNPHTVVYSYHTRSSMYP